MVCGDSAKFPVNSLPPARIRGFWAEFDDFGGEIKISTVLFAVNRKSEQKTGETFVPPPWNARH